MIFSIFPFRDAPSRLRQGSLAIACGLVFGCASPPPAPPPATAHFGAATETGITLDWRSLQQHVSRSLPSGHHELKLNFDLTVNSTGAVRLLAAGPVLIDAVIDQEGQDITADLRLAAGTARVGGLHEKFQQLEVTTTLRSTTASPRRLLRLRGRLPVTLVEAMDERWVPLERTDAPILLAPGLSLRLQHAPTARTENSNTPWWVDVIDTRTSSPYRDTTPPQFYDVLIDGPVGQVSNKRWLGGRQPEGWVHRLIQSTTRSTPPARVLVRWCTAVRVEHLTFELHDLSLE